MKFKKYGLAAKILLVLEESSLDVADLLNKTNRPLGSGYKGAVTNDDYKKFREKKIERDSYLHQERKKLTNKKYLLSTIYELRKDGLIKKTENDLEWQITKEGQKQSALSKNTNTLPGTHYLLEKTQDLTIITFDILEKDRRKRSWLRDVLKNLKFKMVHKSVWMGNHVLPVEFLEDLSKLNILDCVKIFSVSKKGNI